MENFGTYLMNGKEVDEKTYFKSFRENLKKAYKILFNVSSIINEDKEKFNNWMWDLRHDMYDGKAYVINNVLYRIEFRRRAI